MPGWASLAVSAISRSKRSTPIAVDAAPDRTLMATNRSSWPVVGAVDDRHAATADLLFNPESARQAGNCRHGPQDIELRTSNIELLTSNF
jgi:hypothetical protein